MEIQYSSFSLASLLYVCIYVSSSAGVGFEEEEISIRIRTTINSNSHCHIHFVQDVGSSLVGPFLNPLIILTVPEGKTEKFFYKRCNSLSIQAPKIKGIRCVFIINFRLPNSRLYPNEPHVYPEDFFDCIGHCILSVSAPLYPFNEFISNSYGFGGEHVLALGHKSVLLLFSPLNKIQLIKNLDFVHMGMHRIVMIVSYYGSLNPISEFKSILESPKKIAVYFIHPCPTDLSEEILEIADDTDERYESL